jgi:hypothetical protein
MLANSMSTCVSGSSRFSAPDIAENSTHGCCVLATAVAASTLRLPPLHRFGPIQGGDRSECCRPCRAAVRLLAHDENGRRTDDLDRQRLDRAGAAGVIRAVVTPDDLRRLLCGTQFALRAGPDGEAQLDRYGEFCSPACGPDASGLTKGTGARRGQPGNGWAERGVGAVKLVGTAGIEPATSSVSGKRSPAELSALVETASDGTGAIRCSSCT